MQHHTVQQVARTTTCPSEAYTSTHNPYHEGTCLPRSGPKSFRVKVTTDQQRITPHDHEMASIANQVTAPITTMIVKSSVIEGSHNPAYRITRRPTTTLTTRRPELSGAQATQNSATAIAKVKQNARTQKVSTRTMSVSLHSQIAS